MDLPEFLLARIDEDEAGKNTYAAAIGASTDHDQRRWWAECEAKRRIVTAYLDGPDKGELAWGDDDAAEALIWCMAVLALPHANHPDYDEAWRP